MPQNDSTFDYNAARKAGYSDAEIQGYLKNNYGFNFDIVGARKSGYSDSDINSFLSTQSFKKKVDGSVGTTQSSNVPNQSVQQQPTQKPLNLGSVGVGMQLQASTNLKQNIQNFKLQQPQVSNGNLGVDVGQKPVDTQAIKEQQDKTLKKAIVNTAHQYFKNNPYTLKELSKSNDKLSLKNFKGEEVEGQYSLHHLENASLFDKKVAELTNAANNGELIPYKTESGEDKLARPLTGWGNLFNGIKDAWNAKGESNKILNMSEDEFIKHANEQLSKGDDYLPTKPNPESDAYSFGSALPLIGKGVVGGATGAAMATVAPEALEGLPAFTAWLATVPDMANEARANSMIAGYKRAKQENPNISDKDAYNMAVKFSDAAGTQALITGTAMNFVHTGLPPNTGQGLWKAVGQFVKNQPESMLTASAAGTSGSLINDLMKKGAGYKVTGDEAQQAAEKSFYDAATMQLAYNIGFGLFGAPKYLKPQAFEVLAKNPEETTQLTDHAVQQGWITKEQADKTLSEINNYSSLRQTIPANVPEDKAAAITGLIQKNQSLEEEKKFQNPIFHDDINAEIKANEQKAKDILNSSNPLKHETDNLTGERGTNIGGRPTTEEKAAQEAEVPNEKPNVGATTDNEQASLPSVEEVKTKENVGEVVQPKQEEVGNSENVVNLPSNAGQAENISPKETKVAESSSQPFSEKSVKEKLSKLDEAEITDPYDKVLHYFANDGKIHKDAINELFGGKNPKIRINASIEGERRARISIIGKNAPSIDALAHKLWESDKTGKFETPDYKEAIERVLLDFNSKHAMAKDLVERYDHEAGYQKYLDKQFGKEAIDLTNHLANTLSEDEINHILAMDSDESRQKELDDYIENISKEQPIETTTEESGLPKELLGKKSESNLGFVGSRPHTSGEVNLEDLKVLPNGIETAKKTFETDKKFKPTKEPITVGVDINTGEKQLLDGYHRYVAKDGKGTVKAKFIPMKDGDILSFDEAEKEKNKSTPTPKTNLEEHPNIIKLKQERDNAIDEVTKPDIKLKLIQGKDLANAKDPLEAKRQHTEIKERYKKLKQAADCIG